jgi:hypothetical protein
MEAVHRWSAVAAGVAVLLAAPWAVKAWPAQDTDIDAAALLAKVEAASNHPYSGYVESRGTLLLPVADRFTDVGDLFGGKTRMRVWWLADDAWRVDKLLASGETDLIHTVQGTTRWRYEQADATLSRDPDIRLPRTADLVPPAVADLLLDDVRAEEVRRLDPRRVAGIDAPGLRLEPAAEQSSIEHVDLWADPDSGVPLRVEVVAQGAEGVAFTSEFREFSAVTPSAERVAFTAPEGADFEFDSVLDIADAANQYAHVIPPSMVAGLAKSPTADRAVGIYGSGVTRLIAIPMRGREAEPLREQLRITPGAAVVDQRTIVNVGPLGVLLTGECDEGGWLVAGTVTSETLTRAADDLLSGSVYLDNDERLPIP